ncbi:MAG: glycosyltransferase family 2 protein [Bacteroidota bacterium]|nr:glycosyltransferase family 2 protein [Bacteroidota bacterium]
MSLNLLSIIIPAYNEEESIQDCFDRLHTVFSTQDYTVEFIVVNDGSLDGTGDILDTIAKADPRVLVIHFSRNFGHQAAISAGIKHCQSKYAAIIDADLQDPPEIIPDMLATMIRENLNGIYGVRNARKGENYFKKITAKLFYRGLAAITDVKIPLDSGDFRLIDRNIINAFNQLPEKNKYVRGLISWIGYKQAPYYYERNAREKGQTHYSLQQMLNFASNGVLYFSKKPLSIAISLGFICILVGLFLIIYVLLSKYYFERPAVAGWASLLISIIFFGGIQLLCIGVLGLYIGKIFDEIKDRPEFIIQKIYRKNNNDSL